MDFNDLYEQIKKGDSSGVEFLIESKVDLDEITPDNSEDDSTLLDVAITFGHIKITKMLLDAGMKINVSNIDDVRNLSISMLNLLSSHSEQNGSRSSYGNENVINSLLVDICSSSSAKKKNNDLPLILEKIDFLLEKKADINNVVNYRNPLLYAVVHKNYDIASHLIKRKANINIQDISGDTPLMRAVRQSSSQSDIQFINYLIEQKANINLQDNLGSHALLMTHNLLIIETLVENKADINLADNSGKTILSKLSGFTGNNQIVPFLIQSKADVNVIDNSGWTPLMNASYWKNENTVRLLLESKADINITNEYGSAFDFGNDTIKHMILNVKLTEPDIYSLILPTITGGHNLLFEWISEYVFGFK